MCYAAKTLTCFFRSNSWNDFFCFSYMEEQKRQLYIMHKYIWYIQAACGYNKKSLSIQYILKYFNNMDITILTMDSCIEKIMFLIVNILHEFSTLEQIRLMEIYRVCAMQVSLFVIHTRIHTLTHTRTVFHSNLWQKITKNSTIINMLIKLSINKCHRILKVT